MTFYWRIPISLTLRAPWITPGDAAPQPATDVMLARDQDGQFILPATLVKGYVLAATEALVEERVITEAEREEAFGTPSGNRRAGTPADPWVVANEPERGALIFRDLATDLKADNANGRSARVAIDPDLGAAKQGHLLFAECPFAFGKPIEFMGDVILYASGVPGSPQISAPRAKEMLELALGRVFAVGRMKSVGFGRVLERHVGTPVAVAPATVQSEALEVDVTYSLDRPFLVSSSRHSGNLVVGSDTLSGGAIKGTLARAWAATGRLDDAYLASITISHAQPNGRKVLPLSLSISGNTLYCNLDGDVPLGHHRFQSDWKGREAEKVRATLGEGWGDPIIPMTGRSRTAIDNATQTAKYEEDPNGGEGAGQLFSQVSVQPAPGLRWKGTIKAPSDPEKLAELMAILGAGAPGFGKTGAVLSGTGKASANVPSSTGALNLCLVSDACLFSPADAVGAYAADLYRAYFDNLGFDLDLFFAQQRMEGGYIALRYRADTTGYLPWVLTTAGSVFRVRPRSGANVSEVLRLGLPPAKGLSGDWHKFPYLRENGFGQVVHNIVDHAALATGLEVLK